MVNANRLTHLRRSPLDRSLLRLTTLSPASRKEGLVRQTKQ